MNKVPVLLLAAGASSRMGQSKQLLPWGEDSLIEYQTKHLNNLGQRVLTVLGAHFETINSEANLSTEVFFNHRWRMGMGFSIAAGIQQLRKLEPRMDGVLIALLDQPLIPLAHYKQLIEGFETGKEQIVVSTFPDGTWSVPVVFDASYLDQLAQLTGDRGAMRLVKKHADLVQTVECDFLEDMDTMEAYQFQLKRFNPQS